jgi:hypothetical protein
MQVKHGKAKVAIATLALIAENFIAIHRHYTTELETRCDLEILDMYISMANDSIRAVELIAKHLRDGGTIK